MTNEKDNYYLLLEDLCGRLPYGVKVNINGNIDTLDSWAEDDGNYFNFLSDGPECNFGEGFTLDNIKPYLRPMSSMTEDEDKEFALIQTDFYIDGFLYPFAATNMVDWLNVHHFDYRGLIEKGLALVAPGGMYSLDLEEPKCIYNGTIKERKEFCKYCSAACNVKVEEKPISRLEEEIERRIKNLSLILNIGNTEDLTKEEYGHCVEQETLKSLLIFINSFQEYPSPKFKIGNTIRDKEGKTGAFTITDIKVEDKSLVYLGNKRQKVSIWCQDDYEIVNNDLLVKENPASEDLEEEIENWIKTKCFVFTEIDEIIETARHFVEWQKNSQGKKLTK